MDQEQFLNFYNCLFSALLWMAWPSFTIPDRVSAREQEIVKELFFTHQRVISNSVYILSSVAN